MLPSHAKIVIPNAKAIVFDDVAKCIVLYENHLAGGRLSWMLPQWEKVGEARNQMELDAFVPRSVVESMKDLDEAIMWFWHDIED